MKYTFEELCDKALSLWPKEIVVKERVIGKPGSMRFPRLIEIHDEIEGNLIKENNNLLLVIDWAIYKALHTCSKHLDIIHPHDVNRECLRQVFEKDLFETEQLADSRKQYKQT